MCSTGLSRCGQLWARKLRTPLLCALHRFLLLGCFGRIPFGSRFISTTQITYMAFTLGGIIMQFGRENGAESDGQGRLTCFALFIYRHSSFGLDAFLN